MSDEPTGSDEQLRAKRERSLRYMFSKVPFVAALGMQLEHWDEVGARVRMPYQDLVDNGGRTFHGGAVSTLIDTAGAAAVWAGHDYDKGTRSSTVSLSVNFLGAGYESALIAEARCVRRAKELNFVEIHVTDADGKPIADGIQTYRIAG